MQKPNTANRRRRINAMVKGQFINVSRFPYKMRHRFDYFAAWYEPKCLRGGGVYSLPANPMTAVAIARVFEDIGVNGCEKFQALLEAATKFQRDKAARGVDVGYAARSDGYELLPVKQNSRNRRLRRRHRSARYSQNVT